MGRAARRFRQVTRFEPTAMTERDVSVVLALLERNGLATTGVPDNIAGFIVARANGSVVAGAGIERHGSSGLLRSVVVEPAYRDQGIGAALVQKILEHAAREGLIALYLLTTNASNYFQRFEFAVCPREQAPLGIRESWEFRTGCPASAVFMRRSIAGTD
jgi:amino-acid N-acetyltransferase